jgi:phosphate transport system protein
VAEARVSYQEQMDRIRHDVVRLGNLATEAISGGTEALLDANLGAADRVISQDAVLDDLTRSIEERCYQILARQAPVAHDMRIIVTVLRAIHEIERTGDLVVNIAKTTRRLYPGELPPRVRGIVTRMGEQAAIQLRTAIEAFAAEDPARALALPDMDDVMDELQRDMFRAIFDTGTPEEGDLHRAVELALVGRFYERIADHAVTIGRRVAYMATGQYPVEMGLDEATLN